MHLTINLYGVACFWIIGCLKLLMWSKPGQGEIIFFFADENISLNMIMLRRFVLIFLCSLCSWASISSYKSMLQMILNNLFSAFGRGNAQCRKMASHWKLTSDLGGFKINKLGNAFRSTLFDISLWSCLCYS